MKATTLMVQLTGRASLVGGLRPSEGSPSRASSRPRWATRSAEAPRLEGRQRRGGSDHNRERRNSADVTQQLNWLNKLTGDMSPPITPPVLRKTLNGSPATTPEHSPATQLRLGKWVDGLKDNAKVKLGESAYKVSPFAGAPEHLKYETDRQSPWSCISYRGSLCA